MRTQRALLVSAERQPYTLVTDLPIPTPGPTDLLVRLVTAGLNPVDWMIPLIDGERLGFLYPWVGGIDGAGIVEEVGSEVIDFDKGDRVCVPALLHTGVADALTNLQDRQGQLYKYAKYLPRIYLEHRFQHIKGTKML